MSEEVSHEVKRATEIAQLRKQAEAKGRGLNPGEVLDWARKNEGSALHEDLYGRTTDAELADEARLNRIRGYIRVHVRVLKRVQTNQQVTVMSAPAAPVYSPRSLRGGGRGSYVSRQTAETQFRGDVLSDAETHLRTFVRRWGHLEETREVTAAIAAWLDKVSAAA